MGRKVVAEDFVHSFYRLIDPEGISEGRHIFINLDKSEESDFIGFRAPNDSTFVIHLIQPQPTFLQELTLKFCSVIPHEAIEMYGDEFFMHPVGTGPFQFSNWNNGIKLVLLKNENYFEKDEEGNALPYLDAVTVSFLQDRHQEYLQFRNGKYDMLSGLDPSFQEDLLNADGTLKAEYEEEMDFVKLPWLKTDYLGILVDETKAIVREGDLSDKLVRQAINYAIDREEMVRYLRKSLGQASNKGFVPAGMPFFEDIEIEGYTYDVAKAKSLLYQAGYKEGKKVKVTLTATTQYRSICQYIQRKLSEVDIEVKVDLVSTSVHKQKMASFNCDFFRKSWVADFPDPVNYYKLFYSGNFAPDNGPNYSHFSNPHYDLYFEKCLMEKNDSIRVELFNRMEELIKEEAPVIPLFYDETARFYRSHVQGIESNAMNMLSLKRVKVK
jgi:peptide/nickel transport system substrate-binding protein